jgi:prolyl-tRNA synthetase
LKTVATGVIFMKVSQIFFQTLKEVPKEAQIESHRLLYRAGMIQKLASGIYNYLPLVLRSIRKLENIIREELNKRGCQEVLMPAVQPSDIWEESGRWSYYGPELLRFKDRKGSDFCLGPTHEEVITDMVRKNLRSYKQLPYNLYQFQSKFRDEIRPRFGLMRGREFIMKDGYSFDINEEKALESYKSMYDAYNAIFKRCGLKFKPVDAATGAIGGDKSHEFQVLAESGEDLILSCSKCDYAANTEKARTKIEFRQSDEEMLKMEEVHTPDKKAVEDVAEFLGKKTSDFIKSLIFVVDGKPVLVMVPGDREVNAAKIQGFFKADSVELADDATVEKVTGAVTGFAGPVGLKNEIVVALDHNLEGRRNLVSGANKTDYHFINISPERDFTPTVTGDFVVTRKGEICPECDGVLEEFRGIEVGQVFFLGTKYSEKMHCSFIDEKGQQSNAVMGCYGLGVGRTVQAAIEQNHDEFGIKWPMALAPYEAIVLPLQMNKEEVVEAAEKIYRKLLNAGVEAVLDDRDERAGFKFNDADLVGYPVQVIIGAKSLEKGEIEVKIRKTGEKKIIPLDEVEDFVCHYKKEEMAVDY